jgi:hypothetical protein
LRTLAPYFLLALFAMQTPVLHAQTVDKPAAGFTLALSKSPDGEQTGKVVLQATYTNTSKEVDGGRTCATLGAFYLEVVYNGIDETKDYQQHTSLRGAPPCTGIPFAMVLQPGESKHAYLYYKTRKSGTYEFTVVQDTFPKDPARNVTVRSNTVTIAVPAASTGGAPRQ